jgi:hypothetical protein
VSAHLTVMICIVESDRNSELEAVRGGQRAQRLQGHARQVKHQLQTKQQR